MKHNPIHNNRFFFTTSPLPCPYLTERLERRVVTELVGRNAPTLHDHLSLAGYRRSHTIAYAPACPDCDACVAVRVLAGRFKPSRSQRRVWKLNDDIHTVELSADATDEQFEMFSAYQKSRHGDGDMARMDYFDYQALVEETTVKTSIIEFRTPTQDLVAACIMDRISNGLSAVYSFFDPSLNKRSLGSHMILWLLERAKELGLDHVYLGYWIANCPKMSYKAAFQPLEGFTPQGWQALPCGDDGHLANGKPL